MQILNGGKVYKKQPKNIKNGPISMKLYTKEQH